VDVSGCGPGKGLRKRALVSDMSHIDGMKQRCLFRTEETAPTDKGGGEDRFEKVWLSFRVEGK